MHYIYLFSNLTLSSLSISFTFVFSAAMIEKSKKCASCGKRATSSASSMGGRLAGEIWCSIES